MKRVSVWYWCWGLRWMGYSSIVFFLGGTATEVEQWVISLGEPFEYDNYRALKKIAQGLGRGYRGTKRIL